jgi:hypothetical protein
MRKQETSEKKDGNNDTFEKLKKVITIGLISEA